MLENLMIRHDLFPIPLWSFEFNNFETYKKDWIHYLQNEKIYEDYSTTDRLNFTSPNLHKQGFFKPLIDFFDESLKSAYYDMGHNGDIGLTGVWATKHPKGGFHHRHTHKNSFIGGVFYLYSDGPSETASKTIFHNPLRDFLSFEPSVNPKKELLIGSIYSFSFVPGTLLLFPAWLPHNTLPSKNSQRIIIGLNAMPIGQTNRDVFDRYEYVDPKKLNLSDYDLRMENFKREKEK